jgi:hypothetical protein
MALAKPFCRTFRTLSPESTVERLAPSDGAAKRQLGADVYFILSLGGVSSPGAMMIAPLRGAKQRFIPQQILTSPFFYRSIVNDAKILVFARGVIVQETTWAEGGPWRNQFANASTSSSGPWTTASTFRSEALRT